jgi:hypothetical protein
MKHRVRKTQVKKRKTGGRRYTMRGGFRDAIEACEQIARAATEKDAKKIYRKATLQFHPDRPTGSTEQMQQLEDCYNQKSGKNTREFVYEGSPPKPTPEPEPAPPPPPTPPPKRKSTPGPPPAQSESPPIPPEHPRGGVGVIFFPKGDSLDTYNYDEQSKTRLEEILMNGYSSDPIHVLDEILRSRGAFIMTIDENVTEEQLVEELINNGIDTQTSIDFISEALQNQYPDISFPTKRRYDLVVLGDI